MDFAGISRRSLLQALGAPIATAALPIGWADIVQAMDAAQLSASNGHAALSFFTAAEAADVDAVTAQIVPTDDSPGAREAGAVHFIDRALATFFAQMGTDYRRQLAAFRVACRTQHPSAGSFAALTSAQQIAFLTGVDTTPFFTTTRLLTLLGMFSLPEYGGNRNGVGWTLLGFEDAHVFTSPFGYYDRDYPGFVIDGKTR